MNSSSSSVLTGALDLRYVAKELKRRQQREAAELGVCPDEVLPTPIVRPQTTPREQTQTKRQPPYAVILHNDDINGFDYVVGVLRKVFNYGRMKAFWLTLKAHVT